MQYELSIVIPALRPHYWVNLYNSILSATKLNFELILVSPHDIPESLYQHKNIKLIRDFGSPVRAHQIGLCNASSKYVFWSADDGFFYENSIDAAMNQFKSIDNKQKGLCVKYIEGDNPASSPMLKDDYYYINGHKGHDFLGLPSHWMFMHHGIMEREYLEYFGGFDCFFENIAAASLDFSCRIQNNGCTIYVTELPAHKGDWLHADAGDHGPVHNAFHERDYGNALKYMVDKTRGRIDMDNWKKSDAIWARRWGVSV